MELSKARRLAQQSKHIIGKILSVCKDFKAHPLKWNPNTRDIASRLISLNLASLKRIYAEHPELKPIRVKQLNLFNQ
jgi:hypothetical protein